MIFLALSAVLAAGPTPGAPLSSVQQADPVAQAAPAETPVALEDVEVTGTPLNALIRDFVNEVAAPNRRRGLARWRGRVCVGVANLRAEPAQYIVDRISTVAEDIGLTPGEPGCTANVVIVAADDAAGVADGLINAKRRVFRPGGSGMDRGGAGLREFQASDAPVRWWQVSMPVNSETGERAVRIPGECSAPCLEVMDFAPVIPVFAASRVTSQIIDNLVRTVVIVDVDQIGAVSLAQLADYLAMVSLAQIDPEADTSRYASILNIFDEPEGAPGLTDWDRAYLEGLYDAEQTRQNRRAGRGEIARSILRAHRDMQDAADAE